MIRVNESKQNKNLSGKGKKSFLGLKNSFSGIKDKSLGSTKKLDFSNLFTSLSGGDNTPVRRTEKGESVSNIATKIFVIVKKNSFDEVKDIKEKLKEDKKCEKIKIKRHKEVIDALLGKGKFKNKIRQIKDSSKRKGRRVVPFGRRRKFSLSTIAKITAFVSGFFGGLSESFAEDDRDSSPPEEKTKSSVPEFGTSNPIMEVVEVGSGYNIVKRPDGSVEKQTGSRNWRNNNPGNIVWGDYAIRHGAIASDSKFAIFPTYEMGRKAQEELVFESESYKELPATEAVKLYTSGESPINQASYQQRVLGAVGGQNKKMKDYSPEERQKILDTMREQEGYKPGQVAVVSKPKGSGTRTSTPSSGSPKRVAGLSEQQRKGTANSSEIEKKVLSSNGIIPAASCLSGLNERTDYDVLNGFLNKYSGTPALPGRMDTDSGPWCAKFTNAILRTQGYEGNGSNWAADFINYGGTVYNAYTGEGDISAAQPGDIAVFAFGPKKGHVGFVKSIEGNKALILGGNQNDSVGVTTFDTRGLVAIRRPGGTGTMVATNQEANKKSKSGNVSGTQVASNSNQEQEMSLDRLKKKREELVKRGPINPNDFVSVENYKRKLDLYDSAISKKTGENLNTASVQNKDIKKTTNAPQNSVNVNNNTTIMSVDNSVSIPQKSSDDSTKYYRRRFT